MKVELCGHATIAATHFLITTGIAKGDVIEFATKSGILTAKKVPHESKQSGISISCSNGLQQSFSIELDFPVIPVGVCDPEETPSIPATLGGLSMINVLKTATGDLIVLPICLLNI